MPQNVIACGWGQTMLLPPDLTDWVPDDHVVWSVLGAVEQMDLSAFYGAYRENGQGRAAYEPSMVVALLLYAYARGNRSSRGIERWCQLTVWIKPRSRTRRNRLRRYSVRIAYLGPPVHQVGNHNVLTVSLMELTGSDNPAFERDLTVCSGPTTKVLGSCRKMVVTSCSPNIACKMRQVPVGQAVRGRLPSTGGSVIEVSALHVWVTTIGRNAEQTAVPYRLVVKIS